MSYFISNKLITCILVIFICNEIKKNKAMLTRYKKIFGIFFSTCYRATEVIFILVICFFTALFSSVDKYLLFSEGHEF